MILSDVLGSDVIDAEGRRLGAAIDARFVLGPSAQGVVGPAILSGFIVSPHSKISTWGYERSKVSAPWPIARLSNWLHRGSFLIAWEDIEKIEGRVITLRASARRADASLG
ncbi:MAG: PRC-barrel domain containing protein [Arthrobacter sp.]|jgi:sporulation protein YlmC with PRC-barrel domain|nr:PRC-barrel domain containing protein [Arthrobacter sp.]